MNDKDHHVYNDGEKNCETERRIWSCTTLISARSAVSAIRSAAPLVAFLAVAAGAAVLGAVSLGGCGPGEVAYRPAPQILPPHIKKIAVRLVKNQTQQFGIEDKLTRAILDEFLRNGRYSMVPESEADGIVALVVTRHILTPVQYDAVLTPTAYKLIILTDLQFIDRAQNTILWEEPNFEGTLLFSASTRPGGITEEQAREQVYTILAHDVVKRVIEGFGAVTGTSQRAISDQPPPGQTAPALPSKPVNPNPY